jgi:cell division protein FtsX
VVLWVALARSQAAGLEATQARLRLWGAGELESRLPGVLSGLWIGVPAAVAASASYWFLARPVLARLSSESVLFAAGGATGAGICLAVGLMSILAGAMVGWISTQPR